MEQMPTNDQRWMRRAISVAMRGRGRVEPNPMVGCVIVRNGRVIGEGRHEFFGGPHAEPNALAKCRKSAGGATAYVNLEPCCHTSKKTPPCVPTLIAAGISRVVIGCLDPNPLVSGKGVEQLRAAGVRVEVGVLEGEAKQLNAAYFASVLHRRPYVTLKWAESVDGKVAGPKGQRLTISSPASLKVMHALRSRCDAILIGRGTAEMDDPLLTVRGVPDIRPLLRVVLDTQLRIPPHLKLVKTAAESPVIVFCSRHGLRANLAAARELAARGVTVISLGGRCFLSSVLIDLYGRGVTHLLVEPGPRLARSFLRENLADRVWVFRSRKRIGEKSAPKAEKLAYAAVGAVKVGGDTLTEYLNEGSEVYFASKASADFELVK
jgi:diaminohydroxyphosphoribosylaminopyrimidine deaminase / 5-amino-6-(5-phosphoribosylamino)uracil reductase